MCRDVAVSFRCFVACRFAIGWLAISAFFVQIVLPPSVFALQLASSPFDQSDEGWRVTGDSQSSVPTYLATGGNPGGSVRGFDDVVGGVWLWTAPAKFLGNMSAAYGYPLTYDLRMRGAAATFAYSDVILTGPSLSLHLVLTPPYPQDVIWTSYSALIQDTAGWHTGDSLGPIATASQIRSVLSNLTSLQIRGEFITGADNGDLDNVVLNGGLLGDYNQNSIVDAGDFVAWRKANSTSNRLPNDGGLSTPIGSAHYDLWRSNFGKTSAIGTAVSTLGIPEPASALLCVFLIAAQCLSRFRISAHRL